MNDSSADYRELDLIERFIRGELEGDELKNFLTRLSAEPELKERVLLYESMFRGINASRRSELKDYIAANAVVPQVKSGSNINWLTISSVAACLVLAGGIFYYVNREKGMLTPNKELAVKSPSPQKDEVITESSSLPPADETTALLDTVAAGSEKPIIAMDSRAISDQENAGTVNEELQQKSSAVNAAMGKEEFYSVKTDEFLGDTIVTVQDKNISELKDYISKTEGKVKEKAKERTKDNDTVLTAETKTETKKEPSVSFLVEFWRSPINYRGYRFNPKKLLLFGLADSSFESIYAIGGEYYLKTDQHYYHLIQDDRFNSYLPVTDKNILNKLKN